MAKMRKLTTEAPLGAAKGEILLGGVDEEHDNEAHDLPDH